MLRPAAALACALLLAGCSSLGNMVPWGGASRPKPAELGPNVPVLGVRQVWTAQIGDTQGLALEMRVLGNQVLLASAAGEVAALDARTGGDLWRARIGQPLAAGVGSDGRWSAVTSQASQVIVLEGGVKFGANP
ncbi:hypothetical protein MASR1M59_23620 [Melaminivora sp.]